MANKQAKARLILRQSCPKDRTKSKTKTPPNGHRQFVTVHGRIELIAELRSTAASYAWLRRRRWFLPTDTSHLEVRDYAHVLLLRGAQNYMQAAVISKDSTYLDSQRPPPCLARLREYPMGRTPQAPKGHWNPAAKEPAHSL